MSGRTYSEVMDDFRHHIAVDESVATDPEDSFAIEARINKGLADELDAAHKREIDVLNQRCAELYAEVAAKDEVIKRLNDAIAEEQRRKMATTENSSAVGDGDKSKAPDPVAYAIEGFKKDPAIMQMYEQMNVGNLAKLREALSDMLNAAFVVILRHGNATEEMGRLALCADNARDALATEKEGGKDGNE